MKKKNAGDMMKSLPNCASAWNAWLETPRGNGSVEHIIAHARLLKDVHGITKKSAMKILGSQAMLIFNDAYHLGQASACQRAIRTR